MATTLTTSSFPATYKDDFADSANFHKILFNSGKDVIEVATKAATSDALLIGKDATGNFFRGNIDEEKSFSLVAIQPG